MGAKKESRRTFADLLAEAPEAKPAADSTPTHTIPRPWITVEGQRWHLRGGDASRGKGLHKLLRDLDLLAFHDYMGKRTPIAAEDRERFWQQAVSSMEASEWSDFVGYEYKGGPGERCLLIYEFC